MKASIIAAAALVGAAVAFPQDSYAAPAPDAKKCKPRLPDPKKQFPIPFTSVYRVVAVPEEVVDMMDEFTGGLPGAIGYYDLAINSDLDIICYNIVFRGINEDYQSPANTATHIHEAPRGEAGPPRIAFPNPTDVGDGTRQSVGCLSGPFLTGVDNDAGVDTGVGFTVSQIEADPAAFFADVHTVSAVPGAIRGQLA